ncbi:hypothetical protein LCGC14_2488200 [marine sediment metagenome]|uniref:Uncharacterized protein n=1 Tax=marine sediment metagenome TaxID=412755 RepID=A0A0F9B5K8_9ZZZZ
MVIIRKKKNSGNGEGSDESVHRMQNKFEPASSGNDENDIPLQQVEESPSVDEASLFPPGKEDTGVAEAPGIEKNNKKGRKKKQEKPKVGDSDYDGLPAALYFIAPPTINVCQAITGILNNHLVNNTAEDEYHFK